MYRGTPSPIFDVPEFPALRRVKPLPKRRRTSSGTGPENAFSLAPTSASVQATQSAIALLQQDAAAAFLQQEHPSLDTLGPNGTPEELLVHADSLSARMALQNYYMPILGGVQSFLAGTVTHGNTEGGNNSNTTAAAAAAAALAAVANAGRNGQLSLPLNEMDSIEFGVHFAAAAAAAAAAGVARGGLGGLGMGLAGMNMTMGTAAGTGGGGGGHGATGSSHGRDDEEDDGRGDGDYTDHFRQPGNTKKRKVPANASGSPRGGDRPGSPSSPYMEDEATEGALGGGDGFGAPSEELLRDRDRDRERDRDRDKDRDRERDYESTPPPIYPPPPFPGQLSLLARKRGKLTAVTLAGLQHKEMLKTRKRQLAAVMGALSHGDTLALDQALSASYPLVGGPDSSGAYGSAMGGRGGSGESPPVRKSKRRTVRLARAMKVIMEMPERRNRHPDAVPFPTSVFDFACPSGTADRLIATKEEVAMLRKRFEVELERQAAKAAKMAVASATGGKGFGKIGRGKRERQERDRERVERAQQRAKALTTGTGTVGGGGMQGGDHSPESVDSGVGSPGLGANALGAGGAGGKAKNGKKKKRSALANASNPHHLRNYVPSRLPHSGPGEVGAAAHGPGGTAANANANTIWPLPLRFLSSEIPPRRRSRTKNNTVPTSVPLIQLTHPAEEWICAFCEYDLFYGEDAAYRRAVRNRKKILKRRRRARERAAAAASGAGAGMSAAKGPPPPPPPSEEYDAYEDSVVGVDEFGNAPGHRGGRWKGAPDKEEPSAFG